MKTLTHGIAAATVVAAASLLGAAPAGAVSGHTSCRGFGAETSAEAQAGTVATEIHAFGPGNVDDLVALVQVGGTFGGETVEPLCEPR